MAGRNWTRKSIEELVDGYLRQRGGSGGSSISSIIKLHSEGANSQQAHLINYNYREAQDGYKFDGNNVYAASNACLFVVLDRGGSSQYTSFQEAAKVFGIYSFISPNTFSYPTSIYFISNNDNKAYKLIPNTFNRTLMYLSAGVATVIDYTQDRQAHGASCYYYNLNAYNQFKIIDDFLLSNGKITGDGDYIVMRYGGTDIANDLGYIKTIIPEITEIEELEV